MRLPPVLVVRSTVFVAKQTPLKTFARDFVSQSFPRKLGSNRCIVDKPALVFCARRNQLCSRLCAVQNQEPAVAVGAARRPRFYTLLESSIPGSGPYLRLMRLDKPIGTWLLLWPCLWSMTIATPAGSLPDPKLVALFAAGSLIMRGAGCTINDLVDRDIDGHVERTKSRPLAAGEVSVPQAVAFLAVQLSAGLAVLLSLNNYSIVLGAASLLLVGTYPFMKRVTYWPQAVLGLTFNWGALVGYSAVAGYCDWAVVLPLYLAGVSWTLVYDTIYALQDKDDDLLIGVKSTALLFGDDTKRWLTGFSAATIAGLTLAGVMAHQQWPFFACTGLGAVHLGWQLATVNPSDRADCMRKFVANKWFGALIFAGILASNFVG
eukprot:TRINITY_DN1655_c0_g1_i1.p1 TRINITY_DN1655_c0_g1~~TRINITY_DN1655_c0_g1_i1.p1  ORF type:complete len:377 (+),score=104.14 TRINITY_DN1655_c0_g1_i1:67-1197(+)